MLKIAVFGPIPRAIVKIAVAAKAGFRKSRRRAKRMSFHSAGHAPPGGGSPRSRKIVLKSRASLDHSIDSVTLRHASPGSTPLRISSSYRSSNSIANSSITSASCPPKTQRTERCCQMCARKSGIRHPRSLSNPIQKSSPTASLTGKLLATGCRQPVEPPATLSSRLYPAARDPAFALQSVQDGIQGGRQKTNGAARSALDLAGDLVPMPVAPFELGEHEKLGAPVFASAISGRVHRSHMC